ncbi:tetraacyldisaccharide 4'-kinase [Psychroflexus salis]|uniref:tetraacyldisaccharide 4'-kinase n=1 Tax=Psychroflexus salis TaxID=1526574 RepID=UPI00166AA111|nr:tetraacyldisaccharide 4'-kinase [Psychroflexus salis]
MKLLRKFLLPLTWLYALILSLRNLFYDWGVFSSKQFSVPVICVGNLSMGGSGKSPTIEYLIRLLKNQYHVATLSRGYGRKTKGFVSLDASNEAVEVGDEPLQFKNKFPEIEVAVDELRAHGIQKILEDKNTEVILLDDAFQHRKVQAGFTILLSVYNDLYVNDFVLPAGNLREPKSGAKRADIIIITKCPPSLSEKEQTQIRLQLNLQKHQKVFFSYIAYQKEAQGLNSKIKLSELQNYTLVTGIANPKPLVDFLNEINPPQKHLKFKDHHNFSASEINIMRQERIILTTEKDFTRLKTSLASDQLFYIPIEMKILDHAEDFNHAILSYVAEFA